MSATNRPMTAREWGMLLTLSLVWGGSFFFNEIAVRQLPVFTVVVCRVALAAVILLAVLRLTGQRLPRSGMLPVRMTRWSWTRSRPTTARQLWR